MDRHLRSVAVRFGALVILAALSGCSSKDAAPPEGSDASPPAATPGGDGAPATLADSLRAEYQTIQQRLNGLQQRALQDSVLQADYAALESLIEKGMGNADPQLGEHRDRLGAIQQEMGMAQQEGDQEKFRTLLDEGNTIQSGLMKVQQETLEREDVKTAMDAFRERLVDRMKELDPEAAALMDRANGIAEQLRALAEATRPGTAEPGTMTDED